MWRGMVKWERLEGGGGRWGAAAGPQGPGCVCLQEAYEAAVEYFGENPKTSPPTTFFPMFVRFIRAYKVGGDPLSGEWEEIWGPGVSGPTLGQPAEATHEAGGLWDREVLGLSDAPWGGWRRWSWFGMSWGLLRGGRVGGLQSCISSPHSSAHPPCASPRKQSRTLSCGRSKRQQPKRQTLAPPARSSPR